MMSNIFNIERFATHDGPGIRTTVFFKGCPLHCPWCANPESWDSHPVLLHEQRRCTACGRCAAVCPTGAISLAPEWHMDANRCTRCQACRTACLNDAVSFAGCTMDTAEIMAEVMKDRDYYAESGGGLTVSGGEPFGQPEALLALLQQAKQQGLQTAAETAGCYAQAILRQMDPWIDLYLFDFKHVDPAVLQRITGGDLPLILNNLHWLAAHCPQKVTIRVPVIPGFNADEKTITAILKAASEMGFAKADLLPYHTLAQAKHARMSTVYAWPYPNAMSAVELLPYINVGRNLGISVTIGGQDRKENSTC